MKGKIRAVLDGLRNEIDCWCHTVMGPDYYFHAYGVHAEGCKAAQALYDEIGDAEEPST